MPTLKCGPALIIGTIILGAALVLTIDYLTERSLREAIQTELSEADHVIINEIINNTDSYTAPTYKLKAKNKYGSDIKDITINCNKSDYFYKNQRIKIK